jgi:hypothetical protein
MGVARREKSIWCCVGRQLFKRYEWRRRRIIKTPIEKMGDADPG